MGTKGLSINRKFWQLCSSIKTGIILLILVVIVSAAGTLILQRPATDADEMQRAYSPQLLNLLDAIGLTDVFHAWWFMLLLVLVSLSITAASIQRFPNAWRHFAHPYRSPDEAFRKALPIQKQIDISDPENGLAAAESALRHMGFKAQRVLNHDQVSLHAERNRISEMAVYIVHASLLLIFLGGIVDGLYGWRGFVALGQGQQVNQVELRTGANKPLSFTLQCDGAGQENYSDGTPKRWWSKLAVIENGREVTSKEIAVNDPLVYRGVRFYQASYGTDGQLDKLLLTASPNDGSGPAQQIALGLNETVQLDNDLSVRLYRFIPDYVVRDGHVDSRSDQPDNPAVQMFVTSRKSGKSTEVWLPPLAGFAHNEQSPYTFYPRDLQMGYFTGLQVSYEPGQWAVWAGCLLMGIGLAAAFYLVHMRFWAVPVRDPHGRLMLWIGGAANKNREVFQERFAMLLDKIQEELKKTQRTQTAACSEEQTTALAGD